MHPKLLSEANENHRVTAQKLGEHVHQMRISRLKEVDENHMNPLTEERRKRAEAKGKYEKAKEYQLELLTALREQYLADPEKGLAALDERIQDISTLFKNIKRAGPPQ
ncbi:hypothetical protein IW261DRAFT_1606603 [Armillaria novae-zelandiae]|uniref:Uncharacterized protein n=1 Tax=Armillaria novae-zelandiae TaxID=153914 RepID=A0AA39PCG0_9AGAR|nr:hypothetical protein IW261DRAFT_1606602 [Armillaria novae-zelandiae]KAK0481251.1 hypothetical protein IW261DRAFT_1606603 [Armillaria novae-zelandiae]